MTRYALVRGEEITNVVLWDGDESTWSPPEGTRAVEVPDGWPVDTRWTYDGESFVEPAPPEEETA